MRHRLFAAAPLLALLALAACHPSAFPPNVTPPKAAAPARPAPPSNAPATAPHAAADGPVTLTTGPAPRRLTVSPEGLPLPPAEAGKRFVEAHCSSCHAVGALGASPNPRSPPFREVVKRYPPESLAEAFNEGIVVGHSNMPPFVMSPEQADDVVAYLKTLAP
jgi:mono/diheme cytochrome c family protein